MDDEKIHDDSAFIRPDTVTLYANTNEVFLTKPVQGIILEFPGLGGGEVLLSVVTTTHPMQKPLALKE